MLYKPELAEKLHLLLNEHVSGMDELLTCCHHDPQFPEQTEVVNVCPGCDKRFAHDYQNSSTVSLWETLAGKEFFSFPDYHGKRMSIIDACPTRGEERVHKAVRILLKKMNITVMEPKNTGTKSTCCGDSFYGLIPVEQVKELMVRRTSEMPEDDVVVYCVSCINSVIIGGKRPHYIVDLLFGEETMPETVDPDVWHGRLERYMEAH